MADRDINVTHLVLLAGVAALCLHAAMVQPTSSDLLAVWLAGKAYAAGAPDLIYASDAVFTMRPPPEWSAMASDVGYSGRIYPYLYPPIWAALVAPLTGILSFSAFATLMLVVNIYLIAAMCWLAWRATGRVLPLPGFLFAGLALIHLNYAGVIALNEGQPQVLVAFLTVVAIERLCARAQIASGAALALAAAIKVYPVLYTIAYVARGDWRALASFGVTGSALALASVAMGGWALHLDFLSQLSAVSATAITLPLSFALDGIIARGMGIGAMAEQLSTADHDGIVGRTAVTVKTAGWQIATKAGMLAVLALSAWGLRTRRDDVMIWPAMMVGLSLLSPLAWGYHFLAALAFAPALIPRWGVGPLVLLFTPLCVLLLEIDLLRAPLLDNLSLIGAGVMSAFALACLWRPAPMRRRLPATQPR